MASSQEKKNGRVAAVKVTIGIEICVGGEPRERFRVPLFCALTAAASHGVIDAPDSTVVWPVLRSCPVRLAERAFKEAIEADPSYSDAWNGLGAVSREPRVQQHCLVRAVQLEHNPSAWANLGVLYVRWGLDAQVICQPIAREDYEAFTLQNVLFCTVISARPIDLGAPETDAAN